MVFIVIPDDDSILTWKSIFKTIQPELRKDFKNIFKIKYNKLYLIENEEETTFRVYSNLLLLEEHTMNLQPTKNKQYTAPSVRDLNVLLKDLLISMDSYDSVCVIDRSMYKLINKFLEDKLDIIEYKVDNIPILYIKSNVDSELSKKNREESDKHGIHSLRPVIRRRYPRYRFVSDIYKSIQER